MGWYFTNGATRSELIRELTEPRTDGATKCLRKYASGNTLWTVWEGPSGRWIGCDLLVKSRDGWGHKPMEESMGPCEVSCPLAFLEDVPEVASEDWRERVRRFHALKGVKAGERIVTHSGREYQVKSNIRGRIVASDSLGNLWRIKAANIASVTARPTCDKCGAEKLHSVGRRGKCWESFNAKPKGA